MKHSTFSSKSTAQVAILQAPQQAMFSDLFKRAMLLGGILLGLLAVNSANAQATASLNEQGIIQLSTSEPLSATYKFDISSLHFSSDQELIDFVSTKVSPNFQLRALPSQGKAVLMLKLAVQPTWTVADWNAHLASVCAANPVRQN
jgi:hypothetical protein